MTVSMNREIKIEGTAASYARIALLDIADDLGMALDATTTAPFNVSWNPHLKRGEIRIKNTLVADVDADWSVLRVRDDYPQKFDHVLLRALRNTVAFTDQLGKLHRALKKTGDIGFVGRDTPNFIMGANEPMQALLGAEQCTPNLTFVDYENDTVKMRYANGNAMVYFNIRIAGTEMHVMRSEYTTLGPKEDAFQKMIQRGETAWRNHYDGAVFRQDLHDAMATPQIDAYSVLRAFKEKRQTDDPDFNAQLRISFKFGSLEYRHVDFYNQEVGEVFHNGIKVARLENDQCIPMPPFAEHPDMGRGLSNLRDLWRCQVLDRDPKSFPLFSEDSLKDLVEKTDFGYDL